MPVELIHLPGRREAPGKADLSGAIRLGARTRLMEEFAEIDDTDGVTDITMRLRHGDIVEAIGEIEGGASLLVVGKRGKAADFAKGASGIEPRADRARGGSPGPCGGARLQAGLVRARRP